MITEDNRDAIYEGKICPYCGEPTEYVPTGEAYDGLGSGFIYLCRPCHAWVGVHEGTDKAFGRLANEELRHWRKQAHRWFDPIAINGLIKDIWPIYIAGYSTRQKAYLWLSKELLIDIDYCHIGMFDVEECKSVVELCQPLVERLAPDDDFLPF